MIDISQIASNLEFSADGLWRARTQTAISYPDEGNAICYEVEESSFWFRHRNQCILKIVSLFPPQGAIFDIGGGNGFVASALMKAGFETVLVEPGPGAFNALRRQIPVVIQATLQDAGFHPGSLPAAGLFDVLEHIEDDAQFLQSLAMQMRSGGRLYLTVPAGMWLWSAVDEDSGHYRRYSLPALHMLLEKSGFEVEFASYFFRAMVVPIFLFRALPSRLGWRKSKPVVSLKRELAPPPLPSRLRGRAEPGIVRSGKAPLSLGSQLHCGSPPTVMTSRAFSLPYRVWLIHLLAILALLAFGGQLFAHTQTTLVDKRMYLCLGVTFSHRVYLLIYANFRLSFDYLHNFHVFCLQK